MTAQRKSKNNNKIINYPTHYIYTLGQLYSVGKRSSGGKNHGIGDHNNIASVASDDEKVGRTIEALAEEQNDTHIRACKTKVSEQ